ncbi:MAG TPA: hypothetical protein VIJ60_06960 [Acidimicrobiales bacterium]
MPTPASVASAVSSAAAPITFDRRPPDDDVADGPADDVGPVHPAPGGPQGAPGGPGTHPPKPAPAAAPPAAGGGAGQGVPAGGVWPADGGHGLDAAGTSCVAPAGGAPTGGRAMAWSSPTGA